MQKIIILLVLLCSIGTVHAQAPAANRFEAEIDPIAYALKGFSVHGIWVHHKLRTDLGFFGIEQPEGFNSETGFQVHTRGIGMKINRLIGKNENWFAGLGTGYAANRVTMKETGEQATLKTFSVGVHAGYRWFAFHRSNSFLKSVYIAPWASLDYNHPMNHVYFNEREFTLKTWSIFPTVHLGCKF